MVRAYRSGDAPGALAHARRTLERVEEGAPVEHVVAHVVLGAALLTNREWSAAEEAERRALTISRARRVGFGERLVALENDYDPTNFFRPDQNIAPRRD